MTSNHPDLKVSGPSIRVFKWLTRTAQLSSVASSVSSNTASISSTIMSARAVVENEKVFPVFAKRLASHDVKEYTSTANKLKHWLSSEKAYYPDALRIVSVWN